MKQTRYQAAHYKEHVSLYKKRARKWADANPEKRRAIVRARYHKWRRNAIDVLGGKCISCGFTDIRALQIDHVNSDGHTDELRKKNHHGFYKYVAEVGYTTGRYQVLCANCNWIKFHEKEEWKAIRTILAPDPALAGVGNPAMMVSHYDMTEGVERERRRRGYPI